MAQIARDKQFAIPKAPGKHVREPREGDDIEYRRAVKLLSCCVCRAPAPCDPHHVKFGTGERGMALRSSDKWCVPLCRKCHDDVEGAGSKNEHTWFLDRDIDALALARSMWSAWVKHRSHRAIRDALYRHWGF